jgi:hypothetical protein
VSSLKSAVCIMRALSSPARIEKLYRGIWRPSALLKANTP